jgi:hypothetical protein
MADIAVVARSILRDPLEAGFRERTVVAASLKIPPRGKEAQ